MEDVMKSSMFFIMKTELYIQNIAISILMNTKGKLLKGRGMAQLSAQEISRLLQQEQLEDEELEFEEEDKSEEINLKAKRQFNRFRKGY